MTNRFLPKTFAGGIITGVAVLVLLCMYRSEVFMSENKPLSEAFSIAYSGPAFKVLRLSCRLVRGLGNENEYWSITFNQGDISVDQEGGRVENPCLVYAGEKPAFVIKRKSSYPGYVVFTTGEEKEGTYSPELVTKLLAAVAAGNAEVQRQKQIKSSWDAAR
ncbi:hypothetical protein [Pseudomonas siliginis]|uniref:hypothetical protein n=1 Tax=Pseudomonas siliginis TaxID=2842346 RepID=UPI002093A0AC|nr:hypothetical protein [Pseudomonas siliginis]UST77224.1 hypothetical protein NF676_00145 [Pseudomonas siliginis]